MRRPNGCGTITKLSGSRRRPYAVRIPARDRKGRVVQKYLSYHATQREAFEALEAYRQRLANGSAPAPEDLGVTLQQVYDLWSARKYAKAGTSSIQGYQASWKRLSRFASLPIRKLTIDHYQQIIDEDEQRQASKSTIANDHLLMRALNKYAMERDWITKDYSAFVVLPSVAQKHEKGAFTDLEIARLEQLAAAGVPGADAALVLVYTGFRINEFLSLTRFSYDAEEDALRGGSKTKAGKNRIVPVHPKIKPYILSWLSQSGDTLYQYQGKSLTSAVFRTKLFYPLMHQLNRPQATPHWCRHTFASLLHSAGADELSIKRLMGHSDKDITEHYTHLTINDLRHAILLIA